MRLESDLRQALRACRSAGAFLIGFGFAINVLALASPLYMMQLYDRVLSARSVDTLVMLTLVFTGAIAALAVLDGLRGLVLGRLGVWLDDRLGPPVILAGLRATLASGGSRPAGEGMRDLAAVRGFLSGPSTAPLMDAPWAPMYLGLLFILHPLLGMIGLTSCIVLFGLAVLNEAATTGPLRQANLAATKSMRALDAAFRNAEAIEAMGMREGVLRLWKRSAAAGKEAQRLAGHRAVIIQTSSRFVRLLVQSGIMGVAAWLVLENRASPGVLFGASFLVGRALAPVENAIGTWRSFVSARLAYRRLEQLLESQPAGAKGMSLPPPRGSISIERLVYAVPGSESPILRGVSFSLQPGEVLGLIGPSAAGKTSLARCLTGAWRPTAGHVRLDSADISVWLGADAGQHIGYLPQDVELFAGSVRDNIARLGEAGPSEVIEAAKLVGLHETIMRLPKGYDTDIGEAGLRLSGGQRQRIGLARALFGQPRLVVLDEPNASLDAEGEAALVEAIAQVKARGATVIVIAHRPSILQHADKILLLRDGLVEAFGPRAEIMAKLTQSAAVAPAAARPQVPTTGTRTPVAAMIERVRAELAAGAASGRAAAAVE
jgi:PrtD family type I secretion system ABC transporter